MISAQFVSQFPLSINLVLLYYHKKCIQKLCYWYLLSGTILTTNRNVYVAGKIEPSGQFVSTQVSLGQV